MVGIVRGSAAVVTVLVGLTLGPAQAQQQVSYRLGPVAVLGDGPGLLVAGVGVFDVAASFSSFAGSLTYRTGEKAFDLIGGSLGLLANADGGILGFAGIHADVAFGPVVVTPQLAVAGYRQGDSRNLGGIFQFRQSLDVGYRFSSGWRVGARVAHTSNADINEDNDGANDVMLVVAVPLKGAL